MAQLTEHFDPENLSKAGAIFDVQKLDWLNGRWLREKLSPEEFVSRTLEWAMENQRLIEGLKHSQSRVSKLGDLPNLAGFLLAADVNLTPASFAGLKTSPEDTLAIITMVQADIEKMIEWNVEAIDAELRAVADKLEKKLRVVTPPLFIAMSGSQRSLPLFDSMAILGRSVVRQRLKIAAAVVSSMVGAQK